MKKHDLFSGILGILGILLTLGVILYYQAVRVVKEAEHPVVEEAETEEEERLEGYEEPEETVAYLMAQMKAGNLDGALRSCAVDDLAKYPNTAAYLEYTEDFRGLDMIPPADYDDEAYYDIAKLRLASDFGHMIQACMDELSADGEWEIYEIVKDEPENPDGKYYERLSSISDILGARDVCECIVYIGADGKTLELHLSLAKYRRFWKVILFSPMAQYKRERPDIRRSREEFQEETALDLSAYQEELLPLNYFLITSRSEEDVKKMVYNYCIYLQRGDLLSALTYYDFGNGDREPQFSLELLDRQKEAAVCLQDMYYQMFLQKTDFEWAKRHYYDNAGYITGCLRTTNMQYVDFERFEDTVEAEDKIYWQMRYSYDGDVYERKLMLSHLNGWKIVGLEY